MIKSVTFKKDFRCFSKGDKFEFKPGANIIVGDQGCGKSTLIELIRISFEKTKSDNDSSWRARGLEYHGAEDIISLEKHDNASIIAIDFERESVRDMSQMLYDQMGLQMFGMKSSHGQANMAMLGKFLAKVLDDKEGKITTVLMDEPDAALSPRSCCRLVYVIHRLATKFNRQVIVSAHNPIIIDGKHPLVNDVFWAEVLCLETKRWLPQHTFWILQTTPAENPKKDSKNAKS